MDGQFDECDLTFHELSQICESISKTVSSIYHGRVRYSSDEDEKPTEKSESKSDLKSTDEPDPKSAKSA